MSIVKAEYLVNETMNIYAKKGDKVIFCNPENGRLYNQEDCFKYLKLDQVYTVDHTDVFGSSTDVYLQEVPGVSFNSVMFDDVK